MPKAKAGCTLTDLSAEEKQKVAKLVQQLLRLGQEHDQLNNNYQRLAQQHAELQRERNEEVAKITEDGERCLDKYTKALQLLQEYQNCILKTMQTAQNDAWNTDKTYKAQEIGRASGGKEGVSKCKSR